MDAMDLFEVLSMDERVIVLSSIDEACYYTWNQSATLQCWLSISNGKWAECGIRTLGEQPKSYRQARKAALDWYNGD